VLEAPCQDCSGEGRRIVAGKLEVEIPAGIQDGQRIRLRDQGHAGFQGGSRGDAFVVVRVRPHPSFVRDGDDLHTVVRLTMTDAALGTTVPVAALGGDLELSIAMGTQPGEVHVLRGQGMPAISSSRRGDLYVRLDVAVPRRLTDEQRRALEEFDRQTGPESYDSSDDDDEGFLRRLKSALR
jgi:molecular chaperone DnaJ